MADQDADKGHQDDQAPEALGSRRFPPSVVATPEEGREKADRPSTEGQTGEVALYVMTGIRRIQSSVFDEQQTMQAIGTEFAWLPKGWPLGFEIGAQWSNNKTDAIVQDVQTTLDGFLFELYAGPRIQEELVSVFGLPISAWLGAGITSMYLDIERERNGQKQQESGLAWGWYAHSGLFVPGPGQTIFGFDLRWVGGTNLLLFGESSSADGFQVSILAAINF